MYKRFTQYYNVIIAPFAAGLGVVGNEAAASVAIGAGVFLAVAAARGSALAVALIFAGGRRESLELRVLFIIGARVVREVYHRHRNDSCVIEVVCMLAAGRARVGLRTVRVRLVARGGWGAGGQ